MSADLAELRRTVRDLHADLVAAGLVAWTSGNISARVPGENLMVIKPSGVGYPELTAESMVVCDLGGHAIDDPAVNSMGYLPSSDTATHAYVYRQMPHVGGVVHTHSGYATAWAARGEPVPCVLTAMGDEIGGGIVATLSGHRSPAVLMRSHGVFTIGATARDAVKAAVMCEDAARTVHLARAYGDPPPLPPDQVDALHSRYTSEYGQR